MSELRFRLQLGLQDHYRVERFLGRGGMAEVFLATDLASSRQVAIKVLRPEAAALFGPARFLREIRTVSDLRHTNLLGLLDSGETMDLLYYVMPYAESGSLRDLLDAQGQISIERAVEIVVEIAAALDQAHAAGVVHRDLKPQNILFSNGQALVADFGIARLVREIGPERLSETGIVLGTPHYMSPEQSLGNRRVDQRADVYGLGCVLYEMLAGVPPFTGPTSQAVQARHVHDKMPPLRTLRPTLPRAAEDAVRRALAKVPADRFASVGDFARAFEAGTRAGPETGLRVSRPLAWLGAGLLVGLIAFGAWAIQRHPGPNDHATPAAIAPPSWIIVADFEGPASDPELAEATRAMVCAVLDQSKFCATVPRGQIRNALVMAGKPPDSRLDPELARELAYRRSIRAVLEGSVERLGRGYAIIVRLVEADSARVLATLSETARDQNGLIESVSRICAQVLRTLGGDPKSIRATRRAVDIITPSFPAYRKFVESGKFLFKEPRASIALMHEALALDPDFASAWEGLFWIYGVLGNDSAQIAGREALRRPDRLTESARLNIEAAFADERGDFAEAFDLYRRAVAANPSALGPRNNRANLFLSLGRYEEAIQEYRDAKSISALPIPVLDLNEFLAQLALGRLEEAEQLQRRITAFPDIVYNPLYIAAARGNWTQIEQLASSFASDTTAQPEARMIGDSFLAIPAAVDGSVEAADRSLARGASQAGQIGYFLEQRQLAWSRLLLRRVSATSLPVTPIALATDTSFIDLVILGMEAACRRDLAAAQRFAGRLDRLPGHRKRRLGAAPAVLESWIAGQRGDWRRSRDLLLPAARARGEYGSLDFAAGRVSICWQLADAFEHLGQPDSAAAYLGMALDPVGQPEQVLFARGLASSFLHRRLASLYSRTGRIDVAEFHLEILTRELTRPDPTLRAVVEDTRREVVAMRAMATTGGEPAAEPPTR